jgi:hypothetical protein
VSAALQHVRRTPPQVQRLKHSFVRTYAKVGVFRTACQLVGVPENTIRLWQDVDAVFKRRVQAAKARLVKKLVAGQVHGATVPDNHGRIDAKAGQYLLNNLDPENWRATREEAPVAQQNNILVLMRDVVRSMEPGEVKDLQAQAKRTLLGETVDKEEDAEPVVHF